MAVGAFKITEQFEASLCEFTGAPYAVAVDNCSNALFLALHWALQRMQDRPEGLEWPPGANEDAQVASEWNEAMVQQGPGGKIRVAVPSHTYPSVPCSVIHAGGLVRFYDSPTKLVGPYNLAPTNVWDCALRFRRGMYSPGATMCLSFSGPFKHLKLGKGGAILTDDLAQVQWLKKARNSGRNECSYRDDTFTQLGWNFYMLPEIAAKGLALMPRFLDHEQPDPEDLAFEFPDLSRFSIYQGAQQ